VEKANISLQKQFLDLTVRESEEKEKLESKIEEVKEAIKGIKVESKVLVSRISEQVLQIQRIEKIS
jgi:hypothetical protein